MFILESFCATAAMISNMSKTKFQRSSKRVSYVVVTIASPTPTRLRIRERSYSRYFRYSSVKMRTVYAILQVAMTPVSVSRFAHVARYLAIT